MVSEADRPEFSVEPSDRQALIAVIRDHVAGYSRLIRLDGFVQCLFLRAFSPAPVWPHKAAGKRTPRRGGHPQQYPGLEGCAGPRR